MWMASTVIVPLSNVAFSMQWMPGHQPLHFMDMVGLVVIMFGLVVYRFSSVLLPVYVYIMGGKVDEDLQQMQTRRAAEAHQLKYLGMCAESCFSSYLVTMLSMVIVLLFTYRYQPDGVYASTRGNSCGKGADDGSLQVCWT